MYRYDLQELFMLTAFYGLILFAISMALEPLDRFDELAALHYISACDPHGGIYALEEYELFDLDNRRTVYCVDGTSVDVVTWEPSFATGVEG